MQSDKKVNNDVYRHMGHAWWDDDVGAFSSIRFTVNPVRFGHFLRVLDQERMLERGKRKLLDVGCGGGLLAEEFARVGFEVTGIDPAQDTIETGRAHASTSKPTELAQSLERHGLDQREMRGISPRGDPIAAWLNLRRRARGQISFQELGRRLGLHESDDLSVSDMGYAARRAG